MDEAKLHHVLSLSKMNGDVAFPIVPLLGLSERRTSIGNEIHLVYREQKEYVPLSQVIKSMGGLLQVPSLILSGQVIHILKLWVQ